jgi:23S rRNA 5-hydroxycytidine C2501 synthase
LHTIGTDAVIIQDMGILEMELPPIPIFASTQTHNYEPDKITFLENAGIKRIILARELSLEQIAGIRKKTNVELEFFVHGALCVCFSGQCYFSQATTGRSANRGACSQPCRMQYSLLDKTGRVLVKDKYLLSLKDLNLSAFLNQMIDAGISSFKIEGRLKDINYVKNITAYYRKKLDAIIEGDADLAKASSGKVHLTFEPDPNKTFNRGYTDYFFNSHDQKLSSMLTQKSIGQFVGVVTNVHSDCFEIAAKERIVSGDGICFFAEDEELMGMLINKVENDRIYPEEMNGLFKGTRIYRNKDRQFIKELAHDGTTRKISVSIRTAIENNDIVITACDEDNIEAIHKEQFEKVCSDNPIRNAEIIEKQLKKSGDTIFTIDKIEINSIKHYFFPVSRLNELRRRVLKTLEENRVAAYPVQRIAMTKNSVPYPKSTVDYTGNVTNRKSLDFYNRHGAEVIEDGFEMIDTINGKIIMTTKYCIKHELDICPLKNGKTPEIKDPLYIQDCKNRFRLHFDCEQCQMNIIKEK